MERYNHWQYMRAIAGQLTALQGEGHYLECTDFGQLVTLLARFNELQYPCLVADSDAASAMVDGGSDNLLSRTLYSVYVLCHGQPEDEEAVRKARTQAKAIALQIAARLVDDHRRGAHGLNHLEVGSLRTEPLGAIGDGGYGVALSFTTLAPTGAIYDASQWS